MAEELISIVVPVYNGAPFLRECISSLVKQTYQNIEIVFVDDGSTDDSFEILSAWEKEDLRISIVSQSNNGVTNARKVGVEYSHGKWILFVDADDVLLEDGVELLYKNVSDCDIVIGQVKYTGLWPWPYILKDEKIDSMLYLERILKDQIHSGPWAKLFKRELLLADNVFNIPQSISHGEDTLMNCRIACACNKVALISNEIYHYIYRKKTASFVNKFDSFYYCNLFDKYAWASLSYEAKKKFWSIFFISAFKRRTRWFRRKIYAMLRNLGIKQ